MNRNDTLVLALGAFQLMLAAIVVATPESLGLPPVVLAWGAILNIGVGYLLNRLDRLGTP